MMNITILRYIPFSELEEMIRLIPLKKTDQDKRPVFVYQNAVIRSREMHAEELNPISKYVLKGDLETQRKLRAFLLKNGIDTLNLDGAYVIRNEDTQEEWTLTPPIIEVTEEDVILALRLDTWQTILEIRKSIKKNQGVRASLLQIMSIAYDLAQRGVIEGRERIPRRSAFFGAGNMFEYRQKPVVD